MIAIAAEQGCDVQIDDLVAGSEVSDAELAGASGGTRWITLGCPVTEMATGCLPTRRIIDC